MQPILITGGTGFVGRYVIGALAASGQPLRALIRSSSKIPPDWHRHDLLETVVYDHDSSSAALASAFEGISRVVHLAGLAHAAGPEALFLQSNAEFTANLCAHAKRVGVTHFIHLSSLAAAAPNSASHPIDDRSDFEAETAYGRSKKRAELHVQDALGRSAMAVSLRPPLVIGAKARGNWALLQRLAATGLWLPFASVRAPRNFISRETLVEAIVHLLRFKPEPNVSGNYAIADPRAAELSQILPWLRAGMGRPPRIFSFPPALLMVGGRILGLGRQFSGLLGPLHINDARFRSTFDFTHQSDIQQIIEQSGREYVAAGSRR